MAPLSHTDIARKYGLTSAVAKAVVICSGVSFCNIHGALVVDAAAWEAYLLTDPGKQALELLAVKRRPRLPKADLAEPSNGSSEFQMPAKKKGAKKDEMQA